VENLKPITRQLATSYQYRRVALGQGREEAGNGLGPRAERYTGDVGAGPRVSFGPRGG